VCIEIASGCQKGAVSIPLSLGIPAPPRTLPGSLLAGCGYKIEVEEGGSSNSERESEMVEAECEDGRW